MYHNQIHYSSPKRPPSIQTFEIAERTYDFPYMASQRNAVSPIVSPSQTHIMQLGGLDWTSLYIPYLDSSYTKEYLTYALEMKYGIGKVNHIDFISIPKSKSSNLGIDDISAFVHFDVWYNNDFTQFLRNHLEKHHKYNLSHFYRYFSGLNDVGNYFGECDTFVLMINRSARRSASISTMSSDDIEQVSALSLRRENSLASNLETLANPTDENTYVLERLERRVGLLEEEVRALRNLLLSND